MRVLFTSTSGLGHLYPLLPLARAARDAGDEVLVAVGGDTLGALSDLGFASVETGEPSPADSGRFWAGLPAQAEPNTYVIADFFGRLRARAALPATRAVVADRRPDLVVSEVAEFAGQLAAEEAGIPHVTVGIASMGLPDLTHATVAAAVDELRAELGLPVDGTVPWKLPSTRFVTALPRMLWRSADDVPADTRVYRHEDPEGPVPEPAAVPRSRSGRPTVYASLGSVAGSMPFAAPTYGAVLAGLGALDADVLFTVGGLDRAALGPVPANVHVESYVPQSVAMSCDLVVTHGGSGTTTAALTRGLPMVVVPLFADQMHNADRVAAAGVGVVVDGRQAATALAPAVRRVLAEESFARAARGVAAELRTLPSAGEVLAAVRPAGIH